MGGAGQERDDGHHEEEGERPTHSLLPKELVLLDEEVDLKHDVRQLKDQKRPDDNSDLVAEPLEEARSELLARSCNCAHGVLHARSLRRLLGLVAVRLGALCAQEESLVSVALEPDHLELGCLDLLRLAPILCVFRPHQLEV